MLAYLYLTNVLAVLPVTSCEAERSISTLGRLKTSISQEWLTGLACMYIHSDISINVPDIVSRFAISHPGWMKLSNALIKRMCVVNESGCGLACMDCQKLVTKIPGSTPEGYSGTLDEKAFGEDMELPNLSANVSELEYTNTVVLFLSQIHLPSTYTSIVSILLALA